MYEIILNGHINFWVFKQETLSLEEVGWKKPINEAFVLFSLQQL